MSREPTTCLKPVQPFLGDHQLHPFRCIYASFDNFSRSLIISPFHEMQKIATRGPIALLSNGLSRNPSSVKSDIPGLDRLDVVGARTWGNIGGHGNEVMIRIARV